MTRTSAQRPLSPQPRHAGAAANASDNATNVHENSTRPTTTDNGEPPVREKLKKTSITAESQNPNPSAVAEMCVPGSATASTTTITSPEVKSAQDGPANDRGRLHRKRSFDDVEACEHGSKLAEKLCEDEGSRSRKRSKDSEDGQSDDESGTHRTKSDQFISKDNITEGADGSVKKPDSSPEMSNSPTTDNQTEQMKQSEQNAAEADKGSSQHEEEASLPKIANKEVDAKAAKSEKHITPPPQGDDAQNDDLKEAIGSPKNKRTRDEFTKDEDVSHPSDGTKSSKEESTAEDKGKGDEEPKSKRHRDSTSPQPKQDTEEGTSSTAANTASSVGFSNRSSTSPFATVTSSASGAEKRQSNTIGFASSGFSAMASSTVSPFGTLGGSSTSSTIGAFGSSANRDTKAPGVASKTEENPRVSAAEDAIKSAEKLGFASNIGSSSGFGALGKSPMSGFGSLAGGALTSFASGSGKGIAGTNDKALKPFGAAPDEEEDDGSEAEDEGVKSPQSEDSHPNKRFFAQNVETGEEEEEVIFSCRAKLYNYVKVTENKKEWKERGLGVLKLNKKKPEDEDKDDASSKARFIMRADGSHRVVLNSPIKKELKFGDPNGKPPSNGYLYFWGSMDGKPQLELLQLKMKQDFASQLYEHVIDLQSTM